MVAEEIKVISKKAGKKSSWKWISDGKGGFNLEKGDEKIIGTKVILKIKR